MTKVVHLSEGKMKNPVLPFSRYIVVASLGSKGIVTKRVGLLFLLEVAHSVVLVNGIILVRSAVQYPSMSSSRIPSRHIGILSTYWVKHEA